MMIYPADVGEAYLALAAATGEEKYESAAITIANYYVEHITPEGSWPLLIDAKSGARIAKNLCTPDRIMSFLSTAYEKTEDARYKAASEKCLHYIEERCLKSYNWEGQFEDVAPTANYENLTHFNAKNYLEYITAHCERTEEMLNTALDLCRFIEDQFVVWGKHAPSAHRDTSEWLYPAGLEQYTWYHPINGSTTSAMRAFIAAHRLTEDDLYLEKARALADTVARNQNEESGAIPTYFRTPDCATRLEDFWLNCHTGTAKDMMRIAKYEAELEKKTL